MVPIRNPASNAEINYNRAHRKTRNIVERCFGVLKSRFRCLSKHNVLNYDPQTASKIINACAVLHNIFILNNYPLPPEEEIIDEMELQDYIIDIPDNVIHVLGVSERNQVVRNFFTL